MKNRSGLDILRQRKIQNDLTRDTLMNFENEDFENLYRKSEHMIISTTTKVWIILIIWHAFIFSLIHYKNYDFPKPLSEIEAGRDKFSEESARKFLHGLTSFGVRMVGSDANEHKAVDFILGELNEIKKSSRNKIQIDLQTASGSFDLEFLGGFTNVYDKVKNIVARLSSADNLLHPNQHNASALLVNCHYDSAASSPGASDDAVSCASMMDVLRVMSHAASFNHDVIFLFNGAEETFLQASHAFVTQHRWFRDVKAFINLEAAGANGKEMLFQATPEAQWMIEVYSTVVPHPHLSVLGQEIFQSGAVPSDTDFRIFRDFGGIPGIDMAYTRNGYVYHTRHDTMDRIAPGCVQRSGENLLSLVQAFSSHEKLTNQGAPGDRSQYVFMDLSGLTAFFFPANHLFAFNYIIIITSLAYIAWLLQSRVYRRGILLSLGCIPAMWFISLAVSSLIGLLLDAIGHSMSWYSQPWLLIPLYTLPSLAINILAVQLLKFYLSQQLAMHNSSHLINNSQIFYAALLLLVLSWKQIASSIFLSFILSFFLIQSFSSRFLPTPISHSLINLKVLLLHIILSLPSIYFLSFCVDGIFSTFIPIMGRSGSSIVTDVVMAIMVSIATNLFMSLHLSLVATMKRLKRVVVIIATTTIIFLLLITLTNFGNPFTDHPQNPTNKRIYLQHLRRRFHGGAWDQNVAFEEDNSVVVVPFDRSGLQHLDSSAHEALFDGFSQRACIDQPYCGWAIIVPAIDKISKIYFKNAARLDVGGVQVSFEEPVLKERSIRYSLNVTGPHNLNVYISVNESMHLSDLSHGRGITTSMPPHFSLRKHYFFYMVSGASPPSSHSFHFTLQCANDKTRCALGMVQLAVVGHNFESPTSPTLSSLLHHLPPWTAPVSSEVTYDSWIL